MRKAMKMIGLLGLAGMLFYGVTNMSAAGNGKGEVKLVFSSSTHGYFDPCG